MSTRETRLIALFLGLVATLVLFYAGRTQGYTRDEGYYFEAAERHVAFYEELGKDLAHGSLAGFSRANVDRWFEFNHEHPPLMKTLYGLSWRLFHKCSCPSQAGRHPIPYRYRHVTLGWMSESEALRFPANLFGGLSVALAFLFGAHAFSRRAGFVAAVLTLCAPRLFFHAELSCFDAPVVTTWLLTVYLYWRSLEHKRYAVWAGVALGLALATKHNGYFLPFVLAAHYLWMQRRVILKGIVPPLPPAFAYMAVVGPLVYFALWPWLWYDALLIQLRPSFHLSGRLVEYFSFHLHHVYYNFEFLGRNYNKPSFPRDFTLVMTLLTAPVTTLALALIGVIALVLRPRLGRLVPAPVPPAKSVTPPPPPVRIWQAADVGLVERGASRPSWDHVTGGGSSAPGMLVFINAIVPPAILTLTGAPIFGATKHWLAAIPFIALLAGAGVDALLFLLIEAFQWKGRRERAAVAIAVLLACAPAASETYRAHPYALSHYNLIAGGPAGGADLGMNRQFWGYSVRGVLPWLNEHVHKNGAVYWHDANQDQLNMEVRERRLREDLWNTGLEEPGVKASSTAMVIHEKHFDKYEYWIWDFYGTARPSFVLTDEGVPLVTVYQRPPK